MAAKNSVFWGQKLHLGNWAPDSPALGSRAPGLNLPDTIGSAGDVGEDVDEDEDCAGDDYEKV